MSKPDEIQPNTLSNNRDEIPRTVDLGSAPTHIAGVPVVQPELAESEWMPKLSQAPFCDVCKKWHDHTFICPGPAPMTAGGVPFHPQFDAGPGFVERAKAHVRPPEDEVKRAAEAARAAAGDPVELMEALETSVTGAKQERKRSGRPPGDDLPELGDQRFRPPKAKRDVQPILKAKGKKP